MTEQTKTPQSAFIPHIERIEGTPILVKDDHGEYESLEQYLITPTRTRLCEGLEQFDSFIDALKTRFDKEKAAVYVRQIEGNGKFNYFYIEGYGLDCRTEPQWRDDFKYVWRSGYTKTARDWLQFNEKPMSQADFALFLDKHLASVVTPEFSAVQKMPTQAELFNFVTTLEDSKGEKFARKVNIQNGDVSVSLERTSDDGTKQLLKLFERFAIGLQLFEGFPTYQVTVKLRYRVKDGQVIFIYDIEGLEELFITARQWAVERIKAETGLPVYI